MSNYYSITRTNYFSVSDEGKFKEIMASCRADDEVTAFEAEQEDGSIKYGFYCYGSIGGLPEGGTNRDVENMESCNYDEEDVDEDIDCNVSFDALVKALQEILPDGEAILITEIGHENVRYLTGYCSVITRNDNQLVNINDESLKLVRAMLKDDGFMTKMEY